jgi:hypothetical protein
MTAAPTVLHRIGRSLERHQQRSGDRRALRRELDAYTTRADVEDLLAALDRDPRPEVDTVRSLLTDRKELP